MAEYPLEVIFFEASSLNITLIINNYPYEVVSQEVTFPRTQRFTRVCNPLNEASLEDYSPM